MATEASPLLDAPNGADAVPGDKPRAISNPIQRALSWLTRRILPADGAKAPTVTSESPLLPVRVAACAVFGVVCGIVAFVYYTILEAFLEVIWTFIPETFLEPILPASLHALYIPLIALPCAALVGLVVARLGEPGDLASTIGEVHAKGYVDTSHAMPMTLASQASIIGGGSLGPEAPLVAICASVAGWISRDVFGTREKEIVRKHTLCGMACALAAFFGAPLGGSLFALEVNHRFGYQFTEHAMEAVLSGTFCLVVFRGLAGLPIGPIWAFLDADANPTTLPPSSALLVTAGALIGLIGAAFAALFAHTHWAILGTFRRFGLLSRPVPRALVGGVGIAVIGMLLPHTMFWGEYEFQAIANTLPAHKLPHVWPVEGVTGFELAGFWSAVLLGLGKLLAISFTVSGGYRGGFIFPLFAAGAAFGAAVNYAVPAVPRAVAALCFAAALNVAITRTTLATTVILSALAGEVNAAPPILAAALVSLFLTADMPFVKTQRDRESPDDTKNMVVDDGRPPALI